jgi:transcriptional regulator with XRE-family HTH domain
VDQLVKQWLSDVLAQSEISQAELARRIGVRRDTITNILKGRRRLKTDEMMRIAHTLRVNPPRLAPAEPDDGAQSVTLTPPHSIRYVTVVGDVSAEAFKNMDFVDFEPFEIPIPIDARWPEDAVKAWVVRGESINKKASDGDFVVTLDVDHAPRAFQHGDWVIAERIRFGLRERSVRQVQIVEGEIWLASESTDSRFPPLRYCSQDDASIEPVRVTAFVLEFVKFATRF